MSTLHVITSAKGGVGKTLCTISAAAHYLRNQTTVLDLNWNNPDVSRILSRQADPVPRGNFVLWPLSGESLNVLAQAFPFLIPGGALGVWDRIDQAMQYCTTSTMIVDTNLHPANLWPLYADAESVVKDKVVKLISGRGVTSAFIWFVWTLAALRRPTPEELEKHTAYDIFYVSQIVQNLIKTFREQNSRIEVIHVLNPHALFPERTWGNFFRGEFDVEVEGLKELSDPRIATVGEIDFDEFTRIAIDTFDTVNYDGIDDIRTFVPLSRSILENRRGRPKNVFPISIYSADVINYVDHAALAGHADLNTLLFPLTPITRMISRYLSAL